MWIDRIYRSSYSQKEDASIDIFVIDNCPDNVIIQKIKVLLIKILQGMMKQKTSDKGFSIFQRICLRVTYIMGKPFSNKRKYEWYKKISQIGNKRETEFVGGYNNIYSVLGNKFTNKLMHQIENHIFEDVELPIVTEYDSYLTTQYGDYMTPPPEEERVASHSL